MNDLKIVYNHCEYDSDSDTMTTTGKMDFGGKEYDVEFVEHAGQSPIVTVSNDSVEMSYSNGATVDGYGLSNTAEGKALYDAASKIYQAMYDKADEYQHENVDAICARASYENQSIDDAEISIVAIEKNTGDIGDLHGMVMVGDDAFRFLADKDGSIHSLMPQGAMMIGVDVLPLTDELKSAICDAIRDGVAAEMERDAGRENAISQALGEKTADAPPKDDFER